MRYRLLRPLCKTLVAIALLAGPAQAATLKETFSQSYPFSAGSSLTLRNINGAVTLEAWDRNEVQIEAQKEVKAGSDSAARKIMDQVKIDVQSGAGGLHVETKIPKKDSGILDWVTGKDANVNVTYRVHLPRQAVVDAGSVNGHIALTGTHGRAKLETTNGAIEAHGVDGSLDLETTNGRINATGVTGTVKADTTNGGIDLQFASVPHQGDLALSTSNGSVTVKLPRGAGVSVDAATSNGRVHSDFQVAGGEPGKHHLTGDINGGGGKLHIRTTNGGVHLTEG
jgi:DUF4097 and DUF4098 domain-containing protein YvlB